MMKEIYLAGGCFWGTEKYLGSLPGVLDTQVGYANGRTQRPTYEQVCRENTGHAETVRVRYDPQALSLPFLLERFYEVIDPTSVNRQAGDQGEQYRSGIYYVDRLDEPVIRQSMAALQSRLSKPVAIQVQPLENYHPAEEYHQKYLDKNPQGYCHISASKFAQARQAVDPGTPKARYTKPSQEILQSSLTDLQYQVTQNAATEPPFQNPYFDHFEPGLYVDITTGSRSLPPRTSLNPAAAGPACQAHRPRPGGKGPHPRHDPHRGPQQGRRPFGLCVLTGPADRAACGIASTARHCGLFL